MNKEELMEFAELVRSNPDKKLESIVKGYMDYNSINSMNPNELEAVRQHEGEEKVCHCKENCGLHKNQASNLCWPCKFYY